MTKLILSQLAIGLFFVFAVGSSWGLLNIGVAVFLMIVDLIVQLVCDPEEDEDEDGPIVIGNQPAHDVARALRLQAASFRNN